MNDENGRAGKRKESTVLRGARCAIGSQTSPYASICIDGGRITRIVLSSSSVQHTVPGKTEIDLSGFFVMPGLINAHDHLEFSLYPRLGDPPYRNYVEWGEDIHRKFADVIAKLHSIPKSVRLWWGGIRNLLCGVTTVAHHNPLWPELQSQEFPIRVVHKCGWGHSLALGGDLRAARARTPAGSPFIVHACEGVDELAREELAGLDRLGLLDNDTILVHGLALDRNGVALMRERGSSLIVCPSSNHFLFDAVPDVSLFDPIENLTLGSDSPLTAEGDLLDEIRFALRFCGIAPQTAYRMVTAAPAAILRLQDAEGFIAESGSADLIAMRDTGRSPAESLATLSASEIELVMIQGRVQLASATVLKRLPPEITQGLEPLAVDGAVRWLRAPVKKLLLATTQVFAEDALRLGSKRIQAPEAVEREYAL
ncbi:MAG TPA: amidohydrolase family protein [Terracidiphilus sp.]|nr:amidohydrolase family protein [Terracidiphilus sp.]